MKYPIYPFIILCIIWFGLSSWFISKINPFNAYVGSAISYWSELGANNLLDIPLRIFFQPYSIISALIFDWPLKLYYFLILFGPLLFIPLFSRKTIIWRLVLRGKRKEASTTETEKMKMRTKTINFKTFIFMKTYPFY